MSARTLIRPRQRALTAVSPHQGNRTHIIPKRGKPTVTPAAPELNFDMTVGNDGTRYGFVDGLFGAFDWHPDSTTTEPVSEFGARTDFPELVALHFTAGALPGIDTVFLTIPEYSNAAYGLVEALGVYERLDADLHDWIIAKDGQTISGFILVPSTFGPFHDAPSRTTYWLRGTLEAPEIGFTVDDDITDPEIWLPLTELARPKGIAKAAWKRMSAKAQEILR